MEKIKNKKKQQTKETTENTFRSVMEAFKENLGKLKLQKKLHATYMMESLKFMGPSLYGYDVAHTWLVSYITNGLYLLNQQLYTIDEKLKDKCIKFLSYCKSDGAFAGGDGQIAHLAPTYAAFLAIISLGQKAFHLINKEDMYQFFKRRKHGNTFTMMEYGECDLRGIYIVVIIVKLLKMKQDVIGGVQNQIIACQTHEGGLTNVKGAEAHGGYTFCGVAALALMNKLQMLDISRLLSWLSQRQIQQLGGFNGRTNKLVDSCYSFWVGATFNIINNYFERRVQYENKLLYSQQGLQQYIIQACQVQEGGLVDKPEKSRDLYHTSYSLGGLSLSQYKEFFIGNESENKLCEIDPIYNVSIVCLQNARKYEWK